MATFARHEFAAYFDCSGSPAGVAPVLMVSGAVSSLDKWLKFETEWNGVLDKHGVPRPFHMAEFMNQWYDRPDERDEIVGALGKVIRKRTRKTFCSGVLLDDWKKVNEQYQLAECLYYPFPLCALQSMVRLDRWKNRNEVKEPIERVFEDGDLHRDEFLKLLRDQFRDAQTPIFKDKTLVPLQLGDYLAWQLAKTIGRYETGKIEYREQVPDMYWTLARQENKDWGFWNEGSLIEMCHDRGIPKR